VDESTPGADAVILDRGSAAVDPDAYDEAGRPTLALPALQLVRLSLYWLGLSSIFAGVNQIIQGRLQYTGLAAKGHEGEALFGVSVLGAIVAIVVQPTVGAISDYTTSRWGRRKPYIFVGSLLDLVFLAGLANSNSLVAIAAFILLLQFSSNLAQGPFQGYVPDLVPDRQVGLASALVGLMQVLGNVAGFLIAALAIGSNEFGLGLVALGVLEITTMLSVVVRVKEGRPPREREGRSWAQIGASAWGTDILHDRDYAWLVASRLFILIAGALLTNHVVFYLAQVFNLTQEQSRGPQITLLAVVALGTVLSVVPSARISDRIGRKPVIFASCGIGAVGVALVALAPSIPVAVVGASIFGIAAGTFLAVDWALMTDIIPTASSGRYMGISNLATGSAGTIAQLIGGAFVMDFVNRHTTYGVGPRATIGLGILMYVIGALLLRNVNEPDRGARRAAQAESPAAAPS
jgi:MFS family permease